MTAKAVDYQEISGTIKSAIELDGGPKFIVPGDWPLNEGIEIMPEAFRGETFTIKFLESGPSETLSADWARVDLMIEFILDAVFEQHLAQMKSYQQRVFDLRHAATDYWRYFDEERWGIDWQLQHIGKSAIMTFTPLELEVLLVETVV